MTHPVSLSPAQIVDQIVASPYAWPGGYKIHALTDDGGCLCSKCCKDERDIISESFAGDGWHVVGLFVHWEGAPITCDNCNEPYDSEYGDPSKDAAEDQKRETH